ncbi:MAG: kelch repeat-containing protein [candidate division WOR-3 bacterium]
MRRIFVAITLICLSSWAWEAVAPLPSPRYGGALVAVGSKLYYIGGSAVGGVKTRTMFIYDVAADSWSVGESMPTARHRFGAAECLGRIYVFGGWGEGGQLLKSAEVYDPITRQWSPIETLPSPRASVFAGGIYYGLGVHCIGGWTGTSSLRDNLQFQPSSGHWTARAPMPTARCEGAAVSTGAYIYCVGGTADGILPLDINETYDYHGDRWLTFVPMPTPRAGCAAGWTGELAVLGGLMLDGRPTSRYEIFDPNRSLWREGQPLPESLKYLSAATAKAGHESYLFVAGGIDRNEQPSNRVYRALYAVGLADETGQRLNCPLKTLFSRPGEVLAVTDSPADFFSVAGRLVARSTEPSRPRCPSLSPGTYFIRFKSGTLARLIVINR